ncbi:MAG: ATP-dependent Clp protease adapter ClpS [Alphaproteobacteria bacterium]
MFKESLMGNSNNHNGQDHKGQDHNGQGQDGSSGDGDGGDYQAGVIARIKPASTKPPLYKVLMLNDDYTPMDFVIHALQSCFNKPEEEAHAIMLSVHQNGMGLCGLFTKDIAETKTQLVIDLARAHGHPLMCQIERE